MKHFFRLVVLAFAIFFADTTHAKVFQFVGGSKPVIIGQYAEFLLDTSGKLNFEQVRNSNAFKPCESNVPNFNITSSVVWMRFDIQNGTELPNIFLQLAYAVLDHVELYRVESDGSYLVDVTGEEQPVNIRKYAHHNFIFDLKIPPGNTKTYYLKVKSTEQILVPLSVGTYEATFDATNTQDILNGIYVGIILVMALYNLFVFYTVRDKSYLFYVLYIIFVGLTQMSFQGYTYRFLWPGNPWLANQSVILAPALTGITAIEFIKNFLQIRDVSKRFMWVLRFFNLFYIVNIMLSLTGMHQLAQQLLQPNAMLASLAFIYIGISMYRKGNRSAGFFLLAWITFLVGLIIFIMKDVGVLPYNYLTNYILHIGSSVEVVVLSLALADKINIFRKEKEVSQAQAMAALEENARIVREQNVILEAKVDERTTELKEANDGLNKAMKELKDAEMQLVESEKMASLGQLTAGIAHEINNPINFVTSNIKPLKRDIGMMVEILEKIENITLSDDNKDEKRRQIEEMKEEYDFDYLKTEIDYLLNGINEGSSRTAEIVKGLRVFSRLDEDDLKKANINEGMDSTLVIINNILGNVQIEKHYGDIPVIECYPGKLNQVFLNIVTNGIHAVKSKFGDEAGGKIVITTSVLDENRVRISIKDNGTGMDENVKKKLFEPFFTTKEVGEGTGLGLSIAYNTIVKHNGTITVNSAVGDGAEFVIDLPVIHQEINN